ncbi:MAG: hypothetical protein ACRC6N_08200 [Plesiomonas sp.]|uniref:hypothetical protein n=1 Tax=Plesiomonas sp. TaxID=2486279 RepID=UPI003F394CE3
MILLNQPTYRQVFARLRPVRFMSGVCVLTFLALLGCFSSYAHSAVTTPAAPEKSGKTVLTLTNGRTAPLMLSIEQLNALPQHDITTSTPWHTQARTFSGPSLTDVLALGDIESDRIEIGSINGYQITLSSAELAPYDPILATHVDGEEMRIRDNGPIWLILPLDQYPSLHNSAFYAQMAWQIRSINAVKD